MAALICVSILVYLVMWFLAALRLFEIVKMKGHYVDVDFYKCPYFWWTFMTGIIGVLIIIALPDRKGASSSNATKKEELPEI